MADFSSILGSFGLPGIVIAGLSWFVMYLIKEHRKERDQWQKTLEKHSDEMNKNVRANTSVLAGLKTLLETRK